MNYKRFWTSILLRTIFLLFFANFAEMKFCEEFRKNKFVIDFGFQRLRADNTFESYISINNRFFKVVFNTTSNKSLTLIEKAIDVSFDKRYQMAFCVLIGGQCIAGLVDTKTHTIDWFTSEESGDIFKNKVYTNSTKYDLKTFIPSILFKLTSDPNGQRYVYILQQIFRNVVYERVLGYFYVDDNNGFVKEINGSVLGTTVPSIASHQSITAVFSYMIEGKPQNETVLSNGLIIMIKDVQHIKYCLSGLTELNQRCYPHLMQTLIDCSQDSRPVSTTTTELPATTHGDHETNEGKGISLKTILIVIIVISVPIIVLLMAFLIYIYIRRKRSTTTSTLSSSSGSKAESKASREKSDSNKSVVKTIFKREGWESEPK